MVRRTALMMIILLWCGTTASALIFGTEIETIRANPRRYVGETVRIVAEVTETRGVPFTELSLQKVYDRTGTLLILTSHDRTVGDRFRGRVKIYGVATEGAEEVSEQAVTGIADFLVDKDLVQRGDARRAARRVLRFLDQVLNAMDVSLFGVEEA
jgi:hypothetical protein